MAGQAGVKGWGCRACPAASAGHRASAEHTGHGDVGGGEAAEASGKGKEELTRVGWSWWEGRGPAGARPGSQPCQFKPQPCPSVHVAVCNMGQRL